MQICVALVLSLVATGPYPVVGQQPEGAAARIESPSLENRRALLVFVGDPQWSPSSEPFVELDRRAPDALRDVLAARFDLRLVRLPLRLADASDDVRALARRYAIRTVPTLTFTDDEERPLVELGPEDVARPLGLVDLVPLLARRAEQRRRVLEAAMSVRDSARVRRLDGFLRELDPDLAQRFFGRQIDALLSARTDDQRLHDRQRVWRLSRDAFVRGQAWRALEEHLARAATGSGDTRGLRGRVDQFLQLQRPSGALRQKVLLFRARLALRPGGGRDAAAALRDLHAVAVVRDGEKALADVAAALAARTAR